jgi:hypothetical protein
VFAIQDLEGEFVSEITKDVLTYFLCALIVGLLFVTVAWAEEPPACAPEGAAVILAWHAFEKTPVSELVEKAGTGELTDELGEVYAKAQVSILSTDDPTATAFVETTEKFLVCVEQLADEIDGQEGL